MTSGPRADTESQTRHDAQAACQPKRASTAAAFWKFAGAGAAFQAGSSAVDSATIVASLVHYVTGNVYAVGATTALLRLGWLLPQLIVGYLAQRSRRRMVFYAVGAFGRAGCVAAIALLLAVADALTPALLGVALLLLWAAYSLVSGVVAVPYNDIIGRTIPSHLRSRLLAWRFFGGGMLALGVAAYADRLLNTAQVLDAYSWIFALGAALMLISSVSFVSAGEPPVDVASRTPSQGFATFVSAGLDVLRTDVRFRDFLYTQWLGGATIMALPFYVVVAAESGLDTTEVGVLLGAQTVGALASNALWGRVGDRIGKLALLQTIGVLRLLAPIGALLIMALSPGLAPTSLLVALVGQFFLIGALINGVTIGYLGYLMELSPNDRRPAYSGYFNAFASPAALSPLMGAAVADIASLEAVFWITVTASAAQFALYRRLAGHGVARASVS